MLPIIFMQASLEEVTKKYDIDFEEVGDKLRVFIIMCVDALDNYMLAKEERVRLNAMIERDRLQDSGYGDQIMEMQENSWPLEWIRNGTFENIDMCFEMTDVGETILQWCRHLKTHINIFKAPVILPTRPDTFTLGTTSANLVALDNSMLAREELVRLNAMIERDRL